jgi:hypothetical protein
MATLIPARSTCQSRMTAGERRFALRLKEKLETDYLVWYDVPVGVTQRRPDFVILHPRRGLLVLEIKDWKLDTLHDLDKYTAQLKTERGLVKQINPMLQARDAVLIDEGHDFEPEWLKLVAQMVDPETNSLLLLYDDAQAIYAKPERRKMSFASLGIKAVGRTTILKLNYRNTWEVLVVAKAFAGERFDGDAPDDDTPMLIATESIGRHGLHPQLLRYESRSAAGAFYGRI